MDAKLPPRFKVGDRVKIVRAGLDPVGRTAIISEVDSTRLVPHYILKFEGGAMMRVPEFDLAGMDEGGPDKAESV